MLCDYYNTPQPGFPCELFASRGAGLPQDSVAQTKKLRVTDIEHGTQ